MLRRRHREDLRESSQPLGAEEQGGPGEEMTVVGRGARVDGTVVSAGSLRIDGQVTGKIVADGDVILAPPSEVEAEIEGQNVVVAGRFKGNITARAKAELAQGGRVEGDIQSKVLVVGEGAVFSGQSLMDQQALQEDAPAETGGAEPGKEASPERQEMEVAPGEAAETGYSEDEQREGELRMAHEDAARRGAEWFRARLLGPRAEPDLDPAEEPGFLPMLPPRRPTSREGRPELEGKAGAFRKWPVRARGGRLDQGERLLRARPHRWALSFLIVAVLAVVSLGWSLVWSLGLASDLGHARAEVRQFRGAEVELQVSRAKVGSLKADIVSMERLLQEAQLCIGALSTSIVRLAQFDTEEGMSLWARARPNCDQVMGITEA